MGFTKRHVNQFKIRPKKVLRSWVHRFAEGGVAHLEHKQGSERKSRIKEEHLKQIEQWLLAA